MGEISSGVITTVFNFLMLGLVGNIGVAAYGVIANFALVAMAIFNGVSQGAQPIVSDCYGKGDVKSVRKIRNLGLAAALGIAVVLIGAVYGFTDSLVSLFNSEHSAELAAYAHTGMRLYFIGFLFAGINIVGAGFLSATERARESFVTSVMRGFVCIIGCSLLFAAVFGINGVWLSFPASELLTAIVMAVVLVRDNRRL
ncbi:MAG: MATE family efflux transporter [Roseburia hominis]